MRRVLLFLLLVLALGLGAQQKSITIACFNAPPFVDQSLPANGFAGEFLVKLFEAAGYKVTVNVAPFPRAFESAKTGEADAFWPGILTEERKQWFEVGEVAVLNRFVLLARKDKPVSFSTVADLKPYLVGILRGASTGSDLDKATDIRKDESADYAENIRKLVGGRTDLAAGDFATMNSLLKTQFKDDAAKLYFLDKPLSMSATYLMVSKKAKAPAAIIADFDKGLAAMKASGDYDRLLVKYSLK